MADIVTPESRTGRAAAGPEPGTTDWSVPLSGRMQRQGDVLVLPLADAGFSDHTSHEEPPAVTIPTDGLTVVRGEAAPASHVLFGAASWAPAASVTGHATESTTDLGVVVVSSAAYLMHPEHAALGLAPGRYLLRRQREQTAYGPQAVAD